MTDDTQADVEGLVARLRSHAAVSERFGEESTASEDDMAEAVDTIERLTTLQTGREQALEEAAKVAEKTKFSGCLGLDAEMKSANAAADEIAAAIRALKKDQTS